MNTYLLTEGGSRSFKTFVKENYAIMLRTADSYFLKNVTRGIEHDIDSTCGDIRSDIPKIYSRFDEYLAI